MSQPAALQRPSTDVAVIMRREPVASRWQSWRWRLDDVVPNEAAFGNGPRLLLRDDTGERWLHPGFVVELFRDDTEGYELNLTSGAPCWFVLWRLEETAGSSDAAMPRPVAVTLSYNDAARWLDAQETVEQVPAPVEIVEWMRAFNAEHFVMEPKQRRRPQSFRPLQDRFGNPAAITTEKKFGGGGNE